MARKKVNRKAPSRKRYEEQHPTMSLRLDIKDRKCLKEHLASAGCSLADFVKQHLRREESMIEKRVEILASMRMDPSLEGRLRCLEDLVYQIFSVPLSIGEYPPTCPRCQNQDLSRCEGKETESKLACPWVITWRCPRCDFFIDTYHRIDPKSICWVDAASARRIDGPKASATE